MHKYVYNLVLAVQKIIYNFCQHKKKSTPCGSQGIAIKVEDLNLVVWEDSIEDLNLVGRADPQTPALPTRGLLNQLKFAPTGSWT